MAEPVVHFEIIGRDPERLRGFYGETFGWTFDVGRVTAPEVSAPGTYGFTEPGPIPGGVGGGPQHTPKTVFYIGVEDVGLALGRAEKFGGTRVMGPATAEGSDLVVAHFTDPEGNLIGLAGPR